jgi:hypothetical protein
MLSAIARAVEVSVSRPFMIELIPVPHDFDSVLAPFHEFKSKH